MKLWQLVKITQSGFDQISEHFIFTFNYIFDTIKTTTKKSDMVRYSISILNIVLIVHI